MLNELAQKIPVVLIQLIKHRVPINFVLIDVCYCNNECGIGTVFILIHISLVWHMISRIYKNAVVFLVNTYKRVIWEQGSI